MAPKFQEMSENDHDVVFLKLDCNQDNRVSWQLESSCCVLHISYFGWIDLDKLLHACYLQPLAKELGIRVVPTFKIFKDGKVAKEVTGAKIDELKRAIEEVKSS
jgi:thioredoxin 1